MLAVSVGFILLLLSGAAVPVLLLYGRITEERAKVADSAVPGAGGGPRPEGRGAPPASSPAVPADVAPSGAADQPVVDLPSLLRMSELLAAVPRGTREVDGVSLIRELERFVATYGEFNQAYQSLRYGEGTNDCESSRRFSAMVELILARFDRRSRGEPAEAQMDALEKVAESLSVSSTRVFADLVGVKAEEMMDDIYNGAHDPNWKGWVSKGYPEDDWAIGRFGEEGTRTRLSEGVAKARAAAETACGEADRREAGLVDAARAVAVLETQDGLGPRVEAVGLESLSYVQREQFAAQAKRFESASGRARETARDIERDLELGWLKTERSSELRAYVTRIRQWHTFAWWFGIPALRAALDAQVCYIGGEPREWANAFLRSMQEIPRSDIERVARLRWERDGMEVHRQMYAGTKYEGPDLGDVERETPAWLEQTILGEVLLRSRRDPAWRARVQAEAPQQLKSLEPWLGPVSDGSDLDNPVSSLDPSAPPPPPPPPAP